METQPSLYQQFVVYSYDKAYARLWECCLAALAGCSQEFIQNEAREAQISLWTAASGITNRDQVIAEPISDARVRMAAQFRADLADSGLTSRKRTKALNIMHQITRTTPSEVEAWDAQMTAEFIALATN